MIKPGLYYITGISGSGKSSVCAELKQRGFKAYDTDKDNIAFFYNNRTDEPLIQRVASEDRTPEWRAEHTWKAKRETVQMLSQEAAAQPVFLCGVTSNDADEFWDLFSKVFALTLNEATLRGRITDRTGNDFGKNPHELAGLLDWQQTAAGDYQKLGATIIDATQPLEKVVSDILEQIPAV